MYSTDTPLKDAATLKVSSHKGTILTLAFIVGFVLMETASNAQCPQCQSVYGQPQFTQPYQPQFTQPYQPQCPIPGTVDYQPPGTYEVIPTPAMESTLQPTPTLQPMSTLQPYVKGVDIQPSICPQPSACSAPTTIVNDYRVHTNKGHTFTLRQTIIVSNGYPVEVQYEYPSWVTVPITILERYNPDFNRPICVPTQTKPKQTTPTPAPQAGSRSVLSNPAPQPIPQPTPQPIPVPQPAPQYMPTPQPIPMPQHTYQYRSTPSLYQGIPYGGSSCGPSGCGSMGFFGGG